MSEVNNRTVRSFADLLDLLVFIHSSNLNLQLKREDSLINGGSGKRRKRISPRMERTLFTHVHSVIDRVIANVAPSTSLHLAQQFTYLCTDRHVQLLARTTSNRVEGVTIDVELHLRSGDSISKRSFASKSRYHRDCCSFSVSQLVTVTLCNISL